MKTIEQKTIELRDNNIGRLFHKAGRIYSERALAFLHEKGFHDIKLSHGALFANLDIEGTQVTTLAERAGITKQAMGQLANDLEAKGYISKTKDPNDQRAFIIKFTELGKQAQHTAYDIKLMVEQEFTSLLGSKDVGALQNILQKLVNEYHAKK